MASNLCFFVCEEIIIYYGVRRGENGAWITTIPTQREAKTGPTNGDNIILLEPKFAQ